MADTSTTVQKVAAEALGTFVLVFIGCGAAITTGADVPATGLAFGITVLAAALEKLGHTIDYESPTRHFRVYTLEPL